MSLQFNSILFRLTIFCLQLQSQAQDQDRYSDPNFQTFVLIYGIDQSENGVRREIFDDNIKDLADLSLNVRRNATQSWCSMRQGMWFFYSEPNFSIKSEYFGFVKTPRSSNLNNTMKCVKLQMQINNSDLFNYEMYDNRTYTQIRSIRHMTHTNLSVPALSLFRSDGGVFHEELFADGSAISLPESITFGAYGFSGFNNWTIFSETNFTGLTTCLTLPLDYQEALKTGREDASDQTKGLGLLSFGMNFCMTVGSMRIKCSGTEDFIQNPLNTSISILSINGSHLPYGVMPSSYVNPNHSHDTPPSTFPEVEMPGLELTIENRTDPLYFAGVELVLPAPLKVTEYSPKLGNGTGFGNVKKEWGLYSDLDFTGKSYCVQATSKNKITFSTPILVMSVKRGCSSSSAAGKFSKMWIHICLISFSFISIYF